MKIRCNSFWLSLFFCLLIVSSVWAQTFHVPDTGDPAEESCNPHSYTDLGNGIVRDNVTGLEWMKATAPGHYDWLQALEYVDELNDTETFGYTDWRLPTIEELSSLVDAGRYSLAIDPVFDDTVAAYYWSSTTTASNTDGAWGVYFGPGYVGYGLKRGLSYVRAVRGGSYGPFGDYVENSDGTITDNSTGLMWQRCTSGQDWDEENDTCTGSAATMHWFAASEYVDNLNNSIYLGYADWRLPTKNELQTLVDYSTYNPATAFLDTGAAVYWSSTDAQLTGSAWDVNFNSGFVNYESKGNYYYVRAVRGGPCRWCLEDSDCPDDSNFCTGDPVCTDGVCGFSIGPCSGDTPVCDEAGNTCVECLADTDCSDNGTPYCDAIGTCVECLHTGHCTNGDFCDGLETCVAGSCVDGTPPCVTGHCDEDNDTCVECISDGQCDDGLFCTGQEHCNDGACSSDGDPCLGDNGTPYCDETVDQCVECLVDDDCGDAGRCWNNLCASRCTLDVKHRRIRAEKLTKSRKVVLTISSLDEAFDMYGALDLGPLSWKKVKSNRKKNRLKIIAAVPAGLEAGVIPISVGNCMGEVVIEGLR